jgi:hypothetical protein
LGDSELIDLRIGKARKVKVMRDVFDIKVFIERLEVPAG